MNLPVNHGLVLAEESESGDGWHIYNDRGDRIAEVLGEQAAAVAQAAAEMLNADPEVALQAASLVNTPVPWDRFAGAALSALIAHPSTFMRDRSDLPHFATTVAEAAASIADAMILERAKRWVGK